MQAEKIPEIPFLPTDKVASNHASIPICPEICESNQEGSKNNNNNSSNKNSSNSNNETTSKTKDSILELFTKQSDSHLEFIRMKRESILRKLGQQSTIVPAWSGRLVFPGVSWCDTSAIFHSVLGPVAMGPELGRFSHFNLPPDLLIVGRIPIESVFSYLRQVSRSPSRSIGFAQFIGEYSKQPIQLPSTPSVEVETPHHSSLHELISHLQKANRFGVIYSGLNPPSSFARAENLIDKKTGLSSYHGWYIKDLYVMPYEDEKVLSEPLTDLDTDHILMDAINVNQEPSHLFKVDEEAFQKGKNLLFLLFVFARMPAASPLTTDIGYKSSSGSFKYKRLT